MGTVVISVRRRLSLSKASSNFFLLSDGRSDRSAEKVRSRRKSPRSPCPSSSPWSTFLSTVRSDFAYAQPSSGLFALKILAETHTCMHIFVLPAAGKRCSSSSREAQLADGHHQLAARQRRLRLQWLAVVALGGCCSGEVQKAALGGDRWHVCAARRSRCSAWRPRGRDSCSRVQLSRTHDLHESGGCSGQQWLYWDTTLATL